MKQFHVKPVLDKPTFEEVAEQTDLLRCQKKDWWNDILGQYMEFFAAMDGKDAIGRLALTKDSRSNPQIAYLLSLYVNPSHRRKGVASGLLEQAEDTATGWGAGQVTLNVAPANKNAIALYQKQGYEVDDDTRNNRILIMSKKI